MMSAPGTGTGKRVARCNVTCYLRFGVPDAGSVSEARMSDMLEAALVGWRSSAGRASDL